MNKYNVRNPILLRKRVLIRFVEVFNYEISLAQKQRQNRHLRGIFSGKMSAEELHVVALVRKHIGYSPNTIDCDIWCGISGLANRINGKKF